MTVIRVSQRELNRLKVMVDLADGRISIDAAAALMGIGRRQVYRLCLAFATAGASGLISKRRGQPSNRNAAESLLLRRGELRHHRIIAGPYLPRYAQEAAWREGLRRVSNGGQAHTAQLACHLNQTRRIGSLDRLFRSVSGPRIVPSIRVRPRPSIAASAFASHDPFGKLSRCQWPGSIAQQS